jgi:beta-glucosidase
VRIGRVAAVTALIAGATWTVPLVASPSGSPAKATANSCGRWMDAAQTPDARATELLKAMTLDQKIQMVHQQYGDMVGSYGAAGYVPAIPSLCVPALVLNDAGSGLGDAQVGITSYPAAMSQASSWDPQEQYRLGASLGQESFAKGVNVLLGPDVNIARIPLNGRTSEAFGEDPYLAGQTAAAFIQGVQSQHVIATVKHYDANNQETNRGTINEVVDNRTLHEIYQPPFNAAINQGGAGAVMCSYNKVNGAYACQNGPILNTDLKGQMGFPGFVMSDWGATHSTVSSALNGLDMEMSVAQEPDAVSSLGAFGSGGTNGFEDYYAGPLKTAVQSGQVPMGTLDSMVKRILRSMFTVGLFDHPAPSEPTGYPAPVDSAANQAAALSAAEQGSVLLKNTGGTLPVAGSGKKIALIGLDAGPGAVTAAQAGGSVHVNQPDVVTPLEALSARAAQARDTLIYNDGSNVQAAAELAKTSDLAVVYAGYVESEGTDRSNLDYDYGICSLVCETQPSNSDQLIAAVAASNAHTAVVLNTGGPAVMPWLSQVESVLEMWYPGEQDGNAAAALLFGDVDPSGKLPITFPVSLSQLPTRSASQWPGLNGTAVYSEGLLVGYRWYNSRELTPLFPFGYGLSYTTFRFSDLRAVRSGGTVDVSYLVTNTGRLAGADVGEVYVTDPQSAGEPPQQLKGYEKTWLQPGESKTVTVTLPASAFEYWDISTNSWTTAGGNYTIRVGDSSTGEPLVATVPIR